MLQTIAHFEKDPFKKKLKMTTKYLFTCLFAYYLFLPLFYYLLKNTKKIFLLLSSIAF